MVKFLQQDGAGKDEEDFQHSAHDPGEEKEECGHGRYDQQAVEIGPVNLLIHAVKLPDDHIEADQKRNRCQKGQDNMENRMKRLGIRQVRGDDRHSQEKKGKGADSGFLFVSGKSAYDPL